MKRAGLASLVGLVLLIFVVLGGVATSKVVGSSPCLKPSVDLLYTDWFARQQAIETYIRENIAGKDIKPKGYAFSEEGEFGYLTHPELQKPGLERGTMEVGNGYVQTPFGPGFMVKPIEYDYEVVQKCSGGSWEVTKFEKVGAKKPQAGATAMPHGRYANPD